MASSQEPVNNTQQRHSVALPSEKRRKWHNQLLLHNEHVEESAQDSCFLASSTNSFKMQVEENQTEAHIMLPARTEGDGSFNTTSGCMLLDPTCQDFVPCVQFHLPTFSFDNGATLQKSRKTESGREQIATKGGGRRHVNDRSDQDAKTSSSCFSQGRASRRRCSSHDRNTVTARPRWQGGNDNAEEEHGKRTTGTDHGSCDMRGEDVSKLGKGGPRQQRSEGTRAARRQEGSRSEHCSRGARGRKKGKTRGAEGVVAINFNADFPDLLSDGYKTWSQVRRRLQGACFGASTRSGFGFC